MAEDRLIDVGQGVRLNCRIEGNPSGPSVTLAHTLSTNLNVWNAFVPSIVDRFHVLRYDARGHGGSDTPAGAYSLPTLAQDVIALWDALGIKKSHVCGVSQGGSTAIYLATYHSERLLSAVACNSPFEINDAHLKSWKVRIAEAREKGMAGVADSMIERWFTPQSIAARIPVIADVRKMVGVTRVEGYASSMTPRDSISADVRGIKIPLLSVAGEKDGAVPQIMEGLHKMVPGSKYVVIPDAGHMPMLERPEVFSRVVGAFLNSVKA